MFGRVWEFRPAPGRLDDFRRVYAADGAWADLFASQPGFLGTSLLTSLVDPSRFLTLDRWAEPGHWAAFLAASAQPYAALDRECEALVIGERELGLLRTAHAEDAGAMATLSDELGYPVSPDVMRRRLTGVGSRPGDLVLVAVEPEGVMVGWVHVFCAVRLEAEPFAEIGGLIVASAARGNGIGQALLAAAEGWARERGVGMMRVRSNVLRERAHGFYERCGYRSPKSQKVFEKPLDTPSG